MDKMIKKVRKELDSIQYLINDVENKRLREHFKRSVKKIRKELSEFSKNESLHLVSGSFMSLIDRAVKLIEDDKPYTKEFLIHVWYGREEELKKHVESAENNNER